MEVVMKGADKIYALEKDSAEYYIRKVQLLLPGHPVIPMMEGILILWQYNPVLSDSVFNEFRIKMLKTAEIAATMGEDDPERIFFEMASRGLLAEYYADRGSYMKAVGEASRAYTLLKRGFDLADDYPEFLFASGIYNYFREAYPRDNPFVKPFIWFFRSGDIDKGIAQIIEASERSVLSRIESYLYLGYIFLRYEEQPARAQKYMRVLLEEYPQNEYMVSKYLESLNVPGSYQKLPLDVLDSMMISDRLYFRIVGNVFKGIHSEKVLRNDDMAFDYYNQAIGMGNALEGHGDHFKSLAYLGAGRIWRRRNNEENAESYFRLAVLHAQTDEVMSEAQTALR